MILDPDTSQVLAEREALVRPFPDLRAKAGQVIGDTAYLERRVVDHAPRR